MATAEARALARILWDYHRLDQPPERADCILVMGSHDLRVAARGAELFLEGFAPLLVISGGLGNLTRGVWDEPEAEKFARAARGMGVPEEAMLLETRAANTGENVTRSRELLRARGLDPASFVLVHKPYMERRALATFMRQWPGKRACVTSPRCTFDTYPTADIPLDTVIAVMVGDLQRIMRYGDRGFQVPQEVPAEVLEAYERLVALGHTEHLLPEDEKPRRAR